MAVHVLVRIFYHQGHKVTRRNSSQPDSLAGDIVVEAGDDFSGEGEGALVGSLGAFALVHGGDDADQGAVAAVHLDGVLDQVVFGPIFAGHAAVMRPIPVHDQVAELSFGNHYAIGGKGIVPANVDGYAGGFGGEPSGAGQAVHGGVDGIAGALAGKIGHEQFDGRAAVRAGGVDAGEELAGPQNVEGILVDSLVGADPWTQLRGERFDRLARREDFVPAM